jgi:fatty aldehyde-generating acyl-ACP reductase
MKSFAFIVNPLNLKELRNFLPAGKILPEFILKPFLNDLQPFKVPHIKHFKSIQGSEAEGVIIACPILERQKDADFVLGKIIAAGEMAKSAGARIIGLSGYVSVVADKHFHEISKKIKLPVTTGGALTAWSAFEAIYRTAKARDLDLKTLRLAITGASSCTGRLCAKKLFDYVGGFSEIPEADIVINASTALESEIDAHDLKSGALLCDISLYGNIPLGLDHHSDIILIKGGLIKPPFSQPVNSRLAEVALLALEEKFVSYSLGEEINPDKLEEIADISVRHGFEVWAPGAPIL